jgi:2-keto-4-pentenoate hydratase
VTASGIVEQAAQFLFQQHQARARFRPIPSDIRPNSLAQAYEVQEALQALFREAGRGAVAGYKVAAITPVMQRLLDIHQPCAGAIFERTIHRSPARIDARPFIHLAVECEIAVILGEDLPPRETPYRRDDVARAVAAYAAAIELVEDRFADYRTLSAVDLVAENAWNAGIVLGDAVTAGGALDVAKVGGAMRINGRVVGQALAGDDRGHPFDVVSWLGNLLLARRHMLRRGMVVMTGSIVETQFAVPGDEVSIAIDGLGSASFRLM